MGVYTFTQDPLGLSLTPRHESILTKLQDNQELTKEDIEYLFDDSVRYNTLWKRAKEDQYELSEKLGENRYTLEMIIGRMLDETDFMYATQILIKDRVYQEPLEEFKDGIKNYTKYQIEKEVERSIDKLKQLQGTFDKHGDNLKVTGYYKYLRQGYRFKYEVTAETTVSEVISEIKKQVLPKVKEEALLTQESVKELSRLGD